MSTPNPFPLNIEDKEDSWGKLQLMMNVNPMFKYNANEWNKVVDALNFLYKNNGLNPQNPNSAIAWLSKTVAEKGTITNTAVTAGTIKISVGGLLNSQIIKLYFDAQYSTILEAVKTEYTNGNKVIIPIYNTTKGTLIYAYPIEENAFTSANGYTQISIVPLPTATISVNDILQVFPAFVYEGGAQSTRTPYTATQNQTTFSLQGKSENIEVHVNPVYQMPTIDYNITNGNVVFTYPLNAGDIVNIRHY